MKYLETAFGQLAFAWKLYNYGLDGKIDLAALDVPLRFEEGPMILTLPDKVIDSESDLIIALQNNLGIAFGAAAITLNRCREEAGINLADPIVTEIDQFSSLTYQIRNAFAHDIAEPRWSIKNQRYARVYEFGGIRVDLSTVGNKHFDYQDIGGPEVLFQMQEFGSTRVWP
jgi:hypothetical protein